MNNQLEKAEERLVRGEITKEQFEKFSDKYSRQRDQISDELISHLKISSNPEKTVAKRIKIAENLSQEWVSSSF